MRPLMYKDILEQLSEMEVGTILDRSEHESYFDRIVSKLVSAGYAFRGFNRYLVLAKKVSTEHNIISLNKLKLPEGERDKLALKFWTNKTYADSIIPPFYATYRAVKKGGSFTIKEIIDKYPHLYDGVLRNVLYAWFLKGIITIDGDVYTVIKEIPDNVIIRANLIKSKRNKDSVKSSKRYSSEYLQDLAKKAGLYD